MGRSRSRNLLVGQIHGSQERRNHPSQQCLFEVCFGQCRRRNDGRPRKAEREELRRDCPHGRWHQDRLGEERLDRRRGLAVQAGHSRNRAHHHLERNLLPRRTAQAHGRRWRWFHRSRVRPDHGRPRNRRHAHVPRGHVPPGIRQRHANPPARRDGAQHGHRHPIQHRPHRDHQERRRIVHGGHRRRQNRRLRPDPLCHRPEGKDRHAQSRKRWRRNQGVLHPRRRILAHQCRGRLRRR
mmetsp:Transcript_11201/g.23741  ORF Transcript_11201/g.23741 Transcript_11201/m.23741 type:complete len:239 (+) Transcript_11201:488-1204(+)